MKLTALDIKQQSFEKTFRGYDVSEVKAYLSLVANEWEHMVSHQKEMEKEMEQLEAKIDQYERVQEALHETLQTAKESAEQKLERARSEARDKIKKAEMEADQIIGEARQQRQEIRQNILRLLDRRQEIIGGIKNYLDLAQQSLQQFADDENKTFQLPKEEHEESLSSFEKKLQMRKKFSGNSLSENHEEEGTVDTNSDKTKSSGHQSIIPGAEDLDDIIDELD